MKKGFTLVEIIGVIILLSAVALISGVVITQNLKNGKQQLYDTQIEMIKTSLALWPTKPNVGEEYHLTLSQLKNAGLVDSNIKDPITEEYFPNDMVLKIKNENGVVSYEVTTTGNCKSEYALTPKLSFEDVLYVELNSSYVDTIATSKDNENNSLTVTSSGSVNTSVLGNNYITYSVTSGSYCNAGIKTVIVADTTAPVISFAGDLTISLSQVNTYNFLTGVTATDNSGVAPTVTVEKNFSGLRGTYSVKYTASDASGNVTTKYRKVTVN